MSALSIILLLKLFLLGEGQIDNIDTVDQGLGELRQAFPGWQNSYVQDEWDCSEMSAFVCDYLNACGLEAEIKTGTCLQPGKYYAHAWVVCEDRLIECTTLSYINPNRTFYKDLVNTIYLGDMSSEYDWWNSGYIKDRVPPAAAAK